MLHPLLEIIKSVPPRHVVDKYHAVRAAEILHGQIAVQLLTGRIPDLYSVLVALVRDCPTFEIAALAARLDCGSNFPHVFEISELIRQ